MKFFITVLALCFISYAMAAQGDCPAASHCQGCIEDGTTCNACYNGNGLTNITAKLLASAACSTNVTAITDCKHYMNTISATKTIKDCRQCNSKTWLNIKDNSQAASIEVTCSDTAIDTSGCSAAIANCAQSACYKNQSGTYTAVCALCNSGYKGSGTLTANVGYASCTNSSIIANCSYADPLDNTKCQVCAANYAVASNQTSCTSFTTDAGCRQLSAAGGFCTYCIDGYYFDSKTCKMAGGIMAFSAMMLAAFFFN